MRKLGMERLKDVEMMTLTEFHYKKYAEEYKEIDDLYRMHVSAFVNRNAKATKTVGSGKNAREEYMFSKVEDMFDYEKALKQVSDGFIEEEQEKPKKKKLSPAEIALRRNKQ